MGCLDGTQQVSGVAAGARKSRNLRCSLSCGTQPSEGKINICQEDLGAALAHQEAHTLTDAKFVCSSSLGCMSLRRPYLFFRKPHLLKALEEGLLQG